MRCVLVVAWGLWLAVAGLARAGEDEEGFDRLFDGRTLQGWEGSEQSFRVEDGAIVGGTLKERIPRNEFLCTEETFGDFELRLKARLIGEEGRNAGVQFRTKRIPNHHEVIGYQCDMGFMDDRLIWGSIYDESRRRKFLAHGDAERVEKAFKPEDWNEFRIRCEGPRIRIWLNGVPTVDYTEKDESVERTGVIGVQIHGGPPSEAWYKDIRVKRLNLRERTSG